MPHSRLTLAAVLLLALTAFAPAQTLTPEQALNLRRPSDLEFSPSGLQLAFVVTEPPEATSSARHIWMLDIASRRVWQFTYSSKSASSPRWSPDGHSLAFLSNRDGDQQIYLMPFAGGEAHALTTGKRAINSFAWSPDGKQIAFLAPDAPSKAEQKKQTDKDDAIVVDHTNRHARLWHLDVATGATRALTNPAWQVRQVLWNGNQRLIFVATSTPASEDNTNRIFSIPTAGGRAAQIAAPKGPFGAIQLARGGHELAFTASPEAGPEPHDLYLLPLDGDGAARDVSGSTLDRAIGEIVWQPDGDLLADAQTGFGHKLYRVLPDSGDPSLIAAATPNPRSFALDPENQGIAFVGDSATRPPELYLLTGPGAAVQITHLNSSWDKTQLANPTDFHFASFDGVQIEGHWLKPLHAAAGPYPLVVLVHGGPTGAWSDSIESWGQLLAAHGIAAAYFNIRGSTGYGAKFMDMNRADWGGADYKDVMAGVDYLVQQGIADPNRLGIGGWSYGGYMSEWAITQTHRFKAAVSGAGMVDLVAEFDTENGPSYDKWFWGLPYDHPEGFLKHSPFMYLKNAHTPILILQGIADTTDPLGQSTGLYRGLKFYGAPAQLVEYPRENHGFRERQHQIDRLNRILAWYEKYLTAASPLPPG
ncbi:MAG: S9 family peptidase [Terriglobales bacterium]